MKKYISTSIFSLVFLAYLNPIAHAYGQTLPAISPTNMPIPKSQDGVLTSETTHYYDSEALSTEVTNELALISLSLLITGIALIKIPDVVKSIRTKREEKKSIAPFTIPYFGASRDNYYY